MSKKKRILTKKHSHSGSRREESLLLCYLFNRVYYAGAHLSPKSVGREMCVCVGINEFDLASRS